MFTSSQNDIPGALPGSTINSALNADSESRDIMARNVLTW